MKFIRPLVFLLAFAIYYPLPVAVLANYQKIQINNNSFLDLLCINDRGDVGFVTVDAASHEQVYRYRNGVTEQITQLSGDHGWLGELQINNQGQMVWSQQDYDDPNHGNRNVYFYDNSTVRQLNDNQGQYDVTSATPSLNNQGQVVWAQNFWRQPAQVYLFSGGTPTALTTGIDSHSGPRLNDLGWIIWQKKLAGTELMQIIVSDGVTPKTIAGTGSYGWAQINNNGQASYNHVIDSETADIYLYNLSTDQATKVTNNGADKDYTGGPNILNNDGQLVWSHRQYEPVDRTDLFFYSQGVATQITNASNINGSVEMFNLKNGGWIAYEVGPYMQGLYIYHEGSRTLLDSGSYSTPRLNNRGQVAWQFPQTTPGRYAIQLGLLPTATAPVNSLLLD